MGKVTKRDNLEAIIDILEGFEDTEDLVAFATHEIELIDRRAEKPRKMTEGQIANEAMKAEIVEMLSDGVGRTATDIAHALGEDVSVQKASQLLRQLVLGKLVQRTDAKGKTKATFSV